MKLSPRYPLDVGFVIAAAFLAVTAMAFSSGVAGWIAFGVFLAVGVAAVAGAITTRRTGQKVRYSLIGAVALWSVIATGLFTGSALIWLIFAGAIAAGLVALGDLTAHEVTTENVVHRLEVASTPTQASRHTTV